MNTVYLPKLLHYARELAKAEQSNDEPALALAQQRHDEYLKLCKDADVAWLGKPKGELK